MFMHSGFTLFGPTHLAILCAVPALAGALSCAHRRFPAARDFLRLGFATILLMDNAVYYGWQIWRHNLTFPDHMPFELCDASMALTVLSLFLLRPLLFDLAYYWALAGASMALLTPNLLETFPSFGAVQFFLSHGLTVAGVLYLVWSGQASPRPWSVARAMVGVNVFAALVGPFDYLYKTNYFYLRSKPANPSLLDFLGPWPIYIAGTEIVTLVLFLLLYLPVQNARQIKSVATEAVSA
ncbi:MAG TPA: TIGR02206 family membrane protein [Terracidiphilus sp.]|nr:TIGR02206 family membrane protein [Terracidiphilus sp.]